MKNILFTLLTICILTSCENKKINSQISKVISKEYTNPPKLESFKNPEKLIEILTNKNNIHFTGWGELSYLNEKNKWGAHSAINTFGKTSDNGQINDIGYQLLGSEKNYVNEVQIILNIKNPEEKKEALTNLFVFASQTLAKLNIENPNNFKDEILKDNQYYFENETYYLLLKKEKHKEQNYSISNIPDIKLDKYIEVEISKLFIKSK